MKELNTSLDSNFIKGNKEDVRFVEQMIFVTKRIIVAN